MNRIRRFFNQNRELIVRIIIIVVACFVALKLINYVAKIKKEQNSNQANTTLTTNNRSYDRDYAIASGERKNENTYYKENNVINTFFDFCNDKNFEEAYKLLSDECKSVLYPDVETFTKQYGEKLFNEKKDCIIQAWYSNIYRIKITADLLASGSTGETDYIEEYCCVIGEKLNINNFIGMNKMNKIVEKANVTINVKQASLYMDYLDLTINVQNNRETSIMLNTMDFADNVYLLDNNDSKFVALLHEIPEDEFIIGAGKSQDVTIRFDMPYSKVDDIESFNMDNVIADYEQYKELGDSRAIQFSIEI